VGGIGAQLEVERAAEDAAGESKVEAAGSSVEDDLAVKDASRGFALQRSAAAGTEAALGIEAEKYLGERGAVLDRAGDGQVDDLD
jgi:hypothetical protein